MIRYFTLLGLCLYCATALCVTTAQSEHFSASLFAERSAPVAGSTDAMALQIIPEKGWHIYWRNPGETGLAPSLTWQLPAGVTAGKIEYPPPGELIVGGLVSNVHTGPTTLLVDLAIGRDLARGAALPIAVTADILVCSRGMCVPESVSLSTRLRIGDGKRDPAAAGIFDAARRRLPKPLSATARYRNDAGRLAIELPMPDLPGAQKVTGAHVFIANPGVMPVHKQDFRVQGGTLDVDMATKIPDASARLHGVINVKRGTDTTSYRFDAVPADAATAANTAPAFWLALGAAILGGLLLNLMPCVFPILSLKALALVRAGADSGEAKREAIGYAIGAVTVLMGLGAIVIGLRQAGQDAGWAFQLQNIHIVTLLLLLVTAIATNLAGLFELPGPGMSPGKAEGFVGGLGTGGLAAFIATPCTGPFMAGALGAALLLPTPEALAIFAGLGFGLALPFLALGFVPWLRQRMPKPGHWMVTLRHLLSLPMFATAVGLAWIAGREAGVAAMTFALASAVTLGIALWWYGIRQRAGKRGLPAVIPVMAAIAIALLGVQGNATTNEANHLLDSKPYTASRLARLRDAHKPVFVFLTADWCLSCKVNEASSLSSARVANAFQKAHVAVLEGDWTNGNPEVTRLLATEHRAGVPLYLWYGVDSHPRILPQILTPSMLVDLTQ